MVENKLQVNERLFSFDGIIGRHAYLVNMVIICALSTLVILPYTTYLYTHIGNIGDIFQPANMFAKMPLILKVWTIAATAGVCTLSVSNIYRRLNDIFGEVRNGTNAVLSALSVLASFSFVMPILTGALFMFLSFILSLVLLFTRGKITNTFPYDYKKEFNWGAFFGTWIWGLFNKTYITLWYLLLWWTPLSFYFQMYCGLKGNEWAFKNKNCTDVKEFNKSQEKQTLIFTILSLIIIPVLYFILIFAIIAVMAVFAIADTNKSAGAPKTLSSIESNIDKMLNGILSLYFERYDITDYENKFYVSNDVWENADFKSKKDMLELAASKSAEIRRERFIKEQNSGKTAYFSKTKELPRTKIYSSTSNQLLGEFVSDEQAMNGAFKDAIQAALNAYRFYNIEE